MQLKSPVSLLANFDLKLNQFLSGSTTKINYLCTYLFLDFTTKNRPQNITKPNPHWPSWEFPRVAFGLGLNPTGQVKRLQVSSQTPVKNGAPAVRIDFFWGAIC